jgi:hypothetical protein
VVAAPVSVSLYMDVHIPGEVTAELRRRGVDVRTAQEDGRRTASDPSLLDRATELGRALVTFDHHLLGEAKRRQLSGSAFAGVVHCKPRWMTTGELVEQLLIVCVAGDADYMRNHVQWLPM